MTPSEFIRRSALGQAPRINRRSRESGAVYELARIGTALRARLARASRDGEAATLIEALDAFHRDVMTVIGRL